MKHTRESLKHVIDSEINQEVHYYNGGSGDNSIPDYCNSPDDIMPLVIDMGINHVKNSMLNRWKAYKPRQVSRWSWRKTEATNKNLLRAYCVLYILLKQGDV